MFYGFISGTHTQAVKGKHRVEGTEGNRAGRNLAEAADTWGFAAWGRAREPFGVALHKAAWALVELGRRAAPPHTGGTGAARGGGTTQHTQRVGRTRRSWAFGAGNFSQSLWEWESL